jgi:hypothetical protein
MLHIESAIARWGMDMRSLLYKTARIMGDINVVRKAAVGKRLVR